MDSSTFDVIATAVAGSLLVVGVLGTVIPVLPGSILTIIVLVTWAWLIGTTVSWTAGLIGVALALIGMSASLVLTGRQMRAHRIPNGPVLVGVVVGIAGMFIIPVIGLFLGFALGLLLAEFTRRRDLAAAWRSSLAAMKAMGLGMLLEFACASLAAFAFVVGALIHFFG
ncbi:DUF456 domain-containing protein [Corynebacterium comes]|uniref:DUF456 domain-containing protein n=1 Tax=Corynebacterium comes TaxID=2675218 RepID=A0A6B8VR59_9CORY|nr:DUF456 domain-containing protein [Corynebacterium comes]QGU05549.1 hypothetical protein CETAM_11585 [Corynebacterium comes]